MATRRVCASMICVQWRSCCCLRKTAAVCRWLLSPFRTSSRSPRLCWKPSMRRTWWSSTNAKSTSTHFSSFPLAACALTSMYWSLGYHTKRCKYNCFIFLSYQDSWKSSRRVGEETKNVRNVWIMEPARWLLSHTEFYGSLYCTSC